MEAVPSVLSLILAPGAGIRKSNRTVVPVGVKEISRVAAGLVPDSVNLSKLVPAKAQVPLASKRSAAFRVEYVLEVPAFRKSSKVANVLVTFCPSRVTDPPPATVQSWVPVPAKTSLASCSGVFLLSGLASSLQERRVRLKIARRRNGKKRTFIGIGVDFLEQ